MFQAEANFVFQVACTNWKRVLMTAMGKWAGNDPLEIPADLAHSPGTFQRLSNYTLPEIEKKLATYDKLIVVRHPLERLLSAYRNKLEAKNEKSAKYFQSRFGKKIVKVRIVFITHDTLGKLRPSMPFIEKKTRAICSLFLLYS